SNTGDALDRAIALLRDAGTTGGRVLLITDEVGQSAVPRLLKQAEDHKVQLSILGVGTPEGAPIPNQQGGFERDNEGNIYIARLPEDRLRELARQGGGRYHRITSNSSDLD